MYSKDRSERIYIRLSAKEKQRILRFATKHGLTITQISERGIDTYIAQRDKDGEFMK